MEVNRSLIERFFKNACSDEEADVVKQYLDAHPQQASEYLREEWELAGQETTPVPAQKAIWRSLQQALELPGVSRLTLSRLWWSAAAMLIVTMTVWAIVHSQQNSVSHKAAVAVAANTQQIIRLLRLNTGTQPLTLALPDSSEVVLQPGASIRYDSALATTATRQIELEGEGMFKVKKDPSRPFTVWAGSSATTALGTIFNVAPKQRGYCVRLLEGKVLVQLFDSGRGVLKQQVMLKPGQQAYLDTLLNIAQVKQTEEAVEQPAGQARKISKPELHFENAPLAEVLDKLAKYYGVKLSYEKEVINDKYFTGQVKANDSLPVLLQIIAQMNGLQVLSAGEGYQLKPPTIQ